LNYRRAVASRKLSRRLLRPNSNRWFKAEEAQVSKRNTREKIGWAEIELSRVLDNITPAKAIEIIKQLAKRGRR
jgi:hypothetical protein